MNNYPDYSSNKLFPANRKQNNRIHPNSAYELRQQQVYQDEDFYKYNSRPNRLQSPDAYSPNETARLSAIRHASLNEDSNMYRHLDRDRYEFQREHELYSNQRYPDTARSPQYPFPSDVNLRERLLRNGQKNPAVDSMHDSFASANHSRNREIYSDFSRSSFSGQRIQPLNDYPDRDFSSITKQKNFPTQSSNPSEEDYSNFLNRQLLARKASFSDTPSSNIPALSKGEEILKEIKLLQQQQKLQELLNVSLSIAKQIKHSPVLRDVDGESLSNNNSSSKHEKFSEHEVSEKRFQNDSQITFNSGNQTSNIYSQSPSFDNLWSPSDNNITLNKNKSGKTELPAVNEENFLSINKIPGKSISGNKLTTTNMTSEVDKQLSLDSFDSVLPATLDNSSMNNSVLEDNSSASEWTKIHFIPFLGETADTKSTANDMRLSPGSQVVEQPASSASSQNLSNTDGKKEIVKSSLEDAIEKLDIIEPVIGLDFIIENKCSVSVDGSFPFQCKLCNSSITRSLIIDHILGTKHRIRFVKVKDEDLYNHIMSPLVQQIDKENEVYKAAHKMERIYGRGHVVVQEKLLTKVEVNAPGKPVEKIQDHTLPGAFELSNETGEEKNETRTDVSIKGDNSISRNDTSKTSFDVTTPTVKTPCSVSSPGNINVEFSKQVSPNKSEIKPVSVKTEPYIAASLLKDEALLDQKVTVESPLNSISNDASSLSMKRSATSLNDVPYKYIKTEQNFCKTEKESDICENLVCKDTELRKTSLFRSSTPLTNTSIAEKHSLTRLLGHMSKWEISSPEEAEMVSKTVDVLLKLLLRYKLQKEAGNDIENEMKSFLSTYLEKTNKHSDAEKIVDLPLEKKSDTLVTKAGNNALGSISEASTMEVVANKDSNPTNSCPSNNQDTSKCLSTTETVSSKSSDTPVSGLKPPPFFSWTKSNTPPASTAPSSTAVPTAAMSWNSPYGSNLSYYQQQGYGSVPNMYQPYTLPMTHCPPAAALPVPITPVPIVPPLPIPFGLPPPPPPTEPPLPPLPLSENRPPASSSKLMPPLPPPLPSGNTLPGPGHQILPPLPTSVPPPPPPPLG